MKNFTIIVNGCTELLKYWMILEVYWWVNYFRVNQIASTLVSLNQSSPKEAHTHTHKKKTRAITMLLLFIFLNFVREAERELPSTRSFLRMLECETWPGEARSRELSLCHSLTCTCWVEIQQETGLGGTVRTHPRHPTKAGVITSDAHSRKLSTYLLSFPY